MTAAESFESVRLCPFLMVIEDWLKLVKSILTVGLLGLLFVATALLPQALIMAANMVKSVSVSTVVKKFFMLLLRSYEKYRFREL